MQNFVKKFFNKTVILSITLIIILISPFKEDFFKIYKYRMLYIPNSPKSWVLSEPKLSDDFYKTNEAIRIGDNILLFQTKSGGWSKNICMQNKLNFLDKFYSKYNNYFKIATIDNSATTTEIDYLVKLYKVNKNEKYKNALIKGFDYILSLQYPNGGFPQIAEYKSIKIPKYRHQITYNDNATISVMILLKKVLENRDSYDFLTDSKIENIKVAYQKGIDVILKTQLSSGMWAAQYDKSTLEPCYGRLYEPPAIDTRESASIVLFLMSIDNPSAEIKNSVEKAVAWFKKNEIKNKTLQISHKPYKDNITLVDCKNCKPIWARLYDLNFGCPLFSDKSGIIYNDISEVNQERLLNYEWYVDNGNQVLETYKFWKLKNSIQKSIN